MTHSSSTTAVVPSLIGRSVYEMATEATPSTYSAVAGKTPTGSSNSCGVVALRWSHDGRFLASSTIESARILWVWDMTQLRCVAQLQNLAAFLDFRWCPRSNQLAAACGSRTVYVWTEEGQS
jgi:WD40 repeat protein